MILHHAVEGTGRRVLLLHPVGLDHTFLQPLSERMSRTCRVMCMDLRGHGRSPVTPLASGMEAFAEDVHETLIQQRFAPCAVVGFSFGGTVAQTLALLHPADIDALVPCACPGSLAVENRSVAEKRGSDAERGGMGEVVEATLDRWFTPAFRAAKKDAAARERLLTDDPRGWAQGWRAIARIDNLPRLQGVRVPTLCIAGELDKSSPPHVVEAIAKAIPGAEFRVIPGAPHMLFIEQPDAVARELLAFLGNG
jgi:pimeloyl-ACP methyl ester carboxylesterase